MSISGERTGGGGGVTGGRPGEEAHFLSLFLVSPQTQGVSVDPVRMVDAGLASTITFDDVEVAGDALLCQVNQGLDLLGTLNRAGGVGAAAELLGVLRGLGADKGETVAG